MTIHATRTMLGGTIELPINPCRHAEPLRIHPWHGEPGTAGTVAVVGAGKIGLPLAVQFAGHGWSVIAADIQPDVVAAINEGRSHIDEEPGLSDGVRRAHERGLLRATTDVGEAAADADVVVLIVPVVLDEAQRPAYDHMDAAVAAVGPRVQPGTLVVFETTLPVGDTRDRFTPRLAELSGLRPDENLFVAFSPERLYSGAALRNLATYPKPVGGISPSSTQRAAAFYSSVLDTEILAMSSSEAAEFSKLAETTYRDVNIALANEFARYADRIGVDIQEVIAVANSQPYSHVHQPGVGVGGHCIPVYPRFLLANAPDLELVRMGRTINERQVSVVVGQIAAQLGTLEGARVLVLGLTYRSGVRELAYSPGVALVSALQESGATVSAYDPLLEPREIAACGAVPWHWGTPLKTRAIVTQTADARFQELDMAWFEGLQLLYDGRNSLRGTVLPVGVRYVGVGRGRVWR